MAFRSPLAALAQRLHLAGDTPGPLPESSLEMATYLHLGAAGAAGAATAVYGAPLAASIAAIVVSFLVLTLGLYHRAARFGVIAVGSIFAIAAGGAIGWIWGTTTLIVGCAIGASLAALTYGRIVIALRRSSSSSTGHSTWQP